MFRFSRRRREYRRCCTRLVLERLEDRRVLSVNLPSDALSLGALQVDPNSYDEASILVRFRDEYSALAATANQTLGADILSGTKVESLRGDVSWLHRVELSGGVDVEAALAAYRDDPRVAYAEPNFRVRIADTFPNDPRFDEMWPLNNTGQTGGQFDADIDAHRAWDVTQGSSSTVVAVIDTGVDYTHPDLAGNIWVNVDEIPGDGLDNDNNGYVDDFHGYDFINRDGDPMDDQGHGTHVAGTIGAEGNNGLGVSGINWDVQIMALKFLGPDGWGEGSDAIEAIYYAIANGATVTNASWGGDPYSQALYDAIAAAQDADHVFVAAAGNGNMLGMGLDNDAAHYYPASYDLDNIVAVSAVDANDNLASFSNYGHTTVDLAAPGVNVLSTIPGGGYGLSSGTSMAAPHVTGVVALVRDLHPDWTYRQVIDQVLGTVDPLPELYGLNVTGGRLNAAAAVGNPEPPLPPPPAGSLPVQEGFQDGVADFWLAQVGDWNVGGGRYTATPAATNHDLPAVSTLDLDDPLPAHFEIKTTVNADEGRLEFFGLLLSDHLTNGFVVFDYHAPDDFKFAGANMTEDRWVIGYRDASGWNVDAALGETLNASTNYQVRVVIEHGTDVSLEAGGQLKLTHQYTGSVIDGEIGLGMRDSTTHFDNVLVQEIVPDTFGPQLVSSGPFPIYSGPVSNVHLTFNESIDASTFTAEDVVEFSGPGGSVTVISVNEVTGSDGLEFDVSFVSQTELGEYEIVLGPEILDRSGNPMNQDGDDVNGELIEDRAEAEFSIVSFTKRLDFGTSSSPVASGYTGVAATALYSTALGYGWQEASMNGWSRATGGDLLRDFNYGSQGTFLVDVANGQYEVLLTMGDEGGVHDQMSVYLEGVWMDTITTQVGQYANNSYLVDVNDGQLTLHLSDQGGSNANVVINALEVIVAGPDRIAPQVVEVTPTGTVVGTLERIEVSFSEAIDAASFSVEDVTLIGPAGPMVPLAVTPLAADQYEVIFAPQSEPGDYQLAIGPEIADMAGNLLAAPLLVELTVEAELEPVVRLDFGTSSSPVASGYTGVTATALYSAAAGYGWQDASMNGWSRATGGDLLRDFNYATQGTFLVDVANGQYEVVLTMGDEGGLHDQMSVYLEDVWVDTITTPAGQYANNSYLVDVNDGQLTLHLADQGGSNANMVINALEVIVAGPDRIAPQVVEVSPAGTIVGTLERIELSFSEAIDAASFSVEDVTLIGPAGPMVPLAVTPLAADQYEVIFAPQSEPGDYQLAIGPEIADVAGNLLAAPLLVELTVEAELEPVVRLDFGTSSSPVASGYTGVTATALYSAAAGYGWQDTSMNGWSRATGGDLLRDFNYATQGTFLVDVANGQYEVVLTMGDEGGLHDQMSVYLEDVWVDTITTQVGQYANNSYLVDVNDGQLTLHLADQGGSNANMVINALEVIQRSAAASEATASGLGILIVTLPQSVDIDNELFVVDKSVQPLDSNLESRTFTPTSFFLVLSRVDRKKLSWVADSQAASEELDIAGDDPHNAGSSDELAVLP